jgi:hypothetical protein
MDFNFDYDVYGDCVWKDANERMFYSGIILNDVIIRIGDCVKVEISDDSNSENEVDGVDSHFSFGQVLAVFVCSNSMNDISIELRWFLDHKEFNSSSSTTTKRQ